MSDIPVIPEVKVDPMTMVAVAMPRKAVTRGRKVHLTSEFWAEIRALYESGDYSQRQLSNFAKTRGVIVSQSAIARRAMNENWMKAGARAEIEKKAFRQVHDALGNAVRDMLDRHTKMARAFQSEAMIHFVNAQELRKTNPQYAIPAQQLNVLNATVDRAQLMEARSIGFDLETGKNVGSEQEKDADQVPEMRVRVMTEEDEQNVRDKLEREVAGEAKTAAED